MAYVYDGPDSAPPDEQGLVDTFSFDGVTAHVKRSGSPETYVAIMPPDATPYLHTHRNTSNAEVLSFISAHLADLRDMRTDMLRRFKKSSSKRCRYKTGEVAYLMGRPFMIRVLSLAGGGKMRRAARGRMQTSVRTNLDISLVELNVMNAGNYDQRKGTFLSWAAPIVQRNALKFIQVGLEEAGGKIEIEGVDSEHPAPRQLDISEARVVPLGKRLARLDAAHGRILISEDLVGFPPVVLLYTCVREIAVELFPENEEARRSFMAATCPEWEKARELLDDPKSPYRLQN